MCRTSPATCGGGIPDADVDALGQYWVVCPQLRRTLFKPDRTGYLNLAVEKPTIKSAIYEHPEFATFIASMNTHFAVWRKKKRHHTKRIERRMSPEGRDF